jgi:hypothetical protein
MYLFVTKGARLYLQMNEKDQEDLHKILRRDRLLYKDLLVL